MVLDFAKVQFHSFSEAACGEGIHALALMTLVYLLYTRTLRKSLIHNSGDAQSGNYRLGYVPQYVRTSSKLSIPRVYRLLPDSATLSDIR